MKRLFGMAGAVLLAFLILVPIALGADPGSTQTGRVIISAQGDVTVPVGEVADVVAVFDGNATIAGAVKSVVVVNGTATVSGQVETILAVSGAVELETTAAVSGDVLTFDASVHQNAGAVVGGDVRNVAADFVGIGFVLGPAVVLFSIGAGIATILAGLLMAGMAPRQVRAAEAVISHQPVRAFLVGLLGVVAIPVLAILFIVTVIGAPLGLGVLFGVLPLIAFLGYLVAGIWIGEWILRRLSPDIERARPYAAAVVGVLILELTAIVPPIPAIASLFGFGAVLVMAFRAFGSGGVAVETTTQPTPAPIPA
jgi:hypothetical protein